MMERTVLEIGGSGMGMRAGLRKQIAPAADHYEFIRPLQPPARIWLIGPKRFRAGQPDSRHGQVGAFSELPSKLEKPGLQATARHPDSRRDNVMGIRRSRYVVDGLGQVVASNRPTSVTW